MNNKDEDLTLTIHLTDSEFLLLQVAAESTGMTVEEFALTAALAAAGRHA